MSDLPGLQVLDMTPSATVLPPGAGQLHLADRLDVVRRRKGLILLVALLVASGTALWSFMQPPIYQSKATILIDREQKLIPTEVGFVPENNWEWHATQFRIMTSTPVLGEVAKRLSAVASAHPAPSRSLLDGLRAFDEDSPALPVPGSPESQQEREQALVDQLRGIIAIAPVQGTKLADIVVNAKDPDFAAQTANTVADVYIDRNRKSKVDAGQMAGQWFGQQLRELQTKVEQSEQALQAFQLEYGIEDSPNHPNQLEDKLSHLTADLDKIAHTRADLLTRRQQVQALLEDPDRQEDLAAYVPYLEGGGKASLTEKLLGEESRLVEQISDATERYTELHPQMMKLQAALNKVRTRLKHEIQRSLDQQWQMVTTQEKQLQEEVARLKHDKSAIDEHRVQYYMLSRDAQTNRGLYDLFLKQLKGADISSDVTTNNIMVAEPAVPNPNPIAPRKGLNILFGLLVGVIGGVGTAFFLEYWDRSVKGPEDLARYLPGQVSLGIIPAIQDHKEKQLVERLVEARPRSKAADSYRSIRTSVLLSSADVLPSSLLITSSTAGEGKTTVAANLAIALAQLGQQRVVLLDADLRKPRIGKLFRRSMSQSEGEQRGLVHYLVGEEKLDNILYPTDIPGLSIIPHGVIPPNPSELLHSGHMARLLARFREEGTMVVLDSPPVLAVPDALVLASQVSGVVMVIKSGFTRREQCQLTTQQLRSAGGKILGVIFQQAQPDVMPSYYYYYGDYHGYYQADEEPEPSRGAPLTGLAKKLSQDHDATPT